jgi:hypothetical protein
MTDAGQSRGLLRTWRSRAAAVLGHRRLAWLLALVALLLGLPSVWRGLFADDYFHRAALLGSHLFGELAPSPLNMFSFFDGDPARVHRLMDIGFVPWWAYTGMKAAFWRPLTVLTHWLDYRLWPDHVWLMHAQSVAWYAALAAVVVLLYRRLIGVPWIAGLAALLYVFDDAHAMPIAFLANRNALLSAFFGVLALVAHDRWRQDEPRAQATGLRTPRWRLALVGPGLFLLSLLAKEEGIATCAYLVPYALFLDRGPLVRRLLSLAPYAVVLIGWRLVWSGLGYGVAEVGFYVDPLHEPLRYLAALVERAPYLLLGQWTGPPAEAFLLEQVVGVTLVRSLWWIGVALALLLAFLLWPLLRRDTTARFWAVGLLLALLPICTTFPADRMLLFTGLGAMGLLAQFLALVFGTSVARPVRRRWRIPARVAGGVFIAIHLVLAPLALPVLCSPQTAARLIDRLSMRAPLDAAAAQQDVVILNAPSLLHAVYFPLEREFAGLPVPRRVRSLASGSAALTIRRPDAQTLVIRADGGYIGWSFERLFRDERHPMHIGEQVVLTGMTATVTALTADSRPAEAEFRFNVPLEDASLRWLWWHAGEFQPFPLPPVGATMEAPAEPVRLLA